MNQLKKQQQNYKGERMIKTRTALIASALLLLFLTTAPAFAKYGVQSYNEDGTMNIWASSLNDLRIVSNNGAYITARDDYWNGYHRVYYRPYIGTLGKVKHNGGTWYLFKVGKEKQGWQNQKGKVYSYHPGNSSGSSTGSSSSGKFQIVYNAGIPGHNVKIVNNITLARAKEMCKNGGYRSFDYERKVQTAYFQDVNMYDVKLKTNYRNNPYDHYTQDV